MGDKKGFHNLFVQPRAQHQVTDRQASCSGSKLHKDLAPLPGVCQLPFNLKP